MPKKEEHPEIKDLSVEELEALKARIDEKRLNDEDFIILKKTLNFSVWIQSKLKEAGIKLSKLRNLIFGCKTEKRKDDNDDKTNDNDQNKGSPKLKQQKESEPKERKGHGRNSHNAFKSAREEKIKHELYNSGDDCPLNCGGKLYNIDPGLVIRVYGQSEADVVRYEIEKLRCSSCLEVFPANTKDIGEKRYDERFKSTITVRKYFGGMPLHRQEKYFEMQGVPLPDSTQWELTEEVADCVFPIFQALSDEAANGKK